MTTPTRWTFSGLDCDAKRIYRADVVDQVAGALGSYGAIRALEPAAQFNLLMSILGSLSYAINIEAK